jgi:hypothetical protein
MKLGINVIDGTQKGSPSTVYYASPYFLSGTKVQPTTDNPIYPVAKYAEPKLNPGITIPLSPTWANLTASEVLTPPNLG